VYLRPNHLRVGASRIERAPDIVSVRPSQIALGACGVASFECDTERDFEIEHRRELGLGLGEALGDEVDGSIGVVGHASPY